MYRLDRIFPLIAVLLFVAFWTSCSDDPTAPNEKPPTSSTCQRVPIPPPTNTVINVSSVAELVSAVQQANSTGNTTIMLADGTYTLYNYLRISADNVTIRSQSGDRRLVIVRGGGMEGGVAIAFYVTANGFVAADMTIGWTSNCAIALSGRADNPLIHNVRFFDTENWMLQIHPLPEDTARAYNGVVEWCRFEYTAGSGPDELIGGIVCARCRNWTVRNNVFKNIRSPDDTPAPHAISFQSQSSGTLVDNNKIINCDRGIGLGFSSFPTSGHSGGVIRNNVIHTVADVSIGLESADNACVYNNTIFTENYVNSIEYRFAGTVNASIINNLTNAAIASRDGGTGVVENNVVNAQLSWFVNIKGGNGHLARSEPTVVDKGQTLTAVTQDVDCETRPKGSAYDVGADER